MRRLTVAALGAALVLTAPAGLAQPASTEARLSRLERLVNTGTLVELLDRVNALQEEVRGLRGLVEEQEHALTQLRERQRELYLDLDGRLSRLEAGGETRPAAPAPAAGPPSPSAGPSAGPPSPAPQTAAAPAAPAAPASANPLQEQAAYQAAFDRLKEGSYARAAEAFREFLATYPRSGYADNARYWLGETHYVTRDLDAALAEFRKLVAEHPDSAKLTHALLKIGYIHDALGDDAEARRVLEALIREHPDTTAARLAAERLAELASG